MIYFKQYLSDQVKEKNMFIVRILEKQEEGVFILYIFLENGSMYTYLEPHFVHSVYWLICKINKLLIKKNLQQRNRREWETSLFIFYLTLSVYNSWPTFKLTIRTPDVHTIVPNVTRPTIWKKKIMYKKLEEIQVLCLGHLEEKVWKFATILNIEANLG